MQPKWDFNKYPHKLKLNNGDPIYDYIGTKLLDLIDNAYIGLPMEHKRKLFWILHNDQRKLGPRSIVDMTACYNKTIAYLLSHNLKPELTARHHII